MITNYLLCFSPKSHTGGDSKSKVISIYSSDENSEDEDDKNFFKNSNVLKDYTEGLQMTKKPQLPKGDTRKRKTSGSKQEAPDEQPSTAEHLGMNVTYGFSVFLPSMFQ